MTDYVRYMDELQAGGMDTKAARIFCKKLQEDEAVFASTPGQREWALSHGFLPGRIELYGLTEDSWKDYMPDYHYYMLHPMNHHFRIWINDKLTLKYVLNHSELKDLMPEYYIYAENDGSYTYLWDFPDDIQKNGQALWNLLIRKKTLVIKPNSGVSGGFGFIKLELINGELYENNKRIDENRFFQIVHSLKNHIVTEYIYQHPLLAQIWPQSECTLRIIMYKNVKARFEADQWSCLASFARFGTEMSTGASNLSAGGIGVGFDFATGICQEWGLRYKQFATNGLWRIREHPDSKENWIGLKIPNWDFIREKIYKVCYYISSLSYLGFDVIVSAEGMKICEINSLPAMDYVQVLCQPGLRQESARKFFEHKGLASVHSKSLYKTYLKCQIER